MNTITIHQPELIQIGNVSRVRCAVNESGEDREVIFDVDKAWESSLVTENVNAYLIALMPYAMRVGADIELLAPINADLLHSLEEYLIPHLVKYDPLLYPTKIRTSELQYEELPTQGAVATGMSMGVDSFFTVSKYFEPKYENFRLTHLFVEQVGDLVENKLSDRHRRNVDEQTINKVAAELGLPVVYAYSNIRQLFRMKHYFTHTYTSMFYVHMLGKLFGRYFYSSTEDFGTFTLISSSLNDSARHELLSLQSLSTRALALYSGGVASDRIEKTQAIASFAPARKYLRVCLTDATNCMTCWKCRRTLLTLDMQGTLDQFDAVFDIPKYQNDREFHLAWLEMSFQKTPDGISLRELHDFFTAKEPELMKKVQDLYSEVQLTEFQPMKNPRRLIVTQDLYKIDPFKPEALFGDCFPAGKLIKAGTSILFDEVVTVMGQKYLRTRKDSQEGANLAIPLTALESTKASAQ